MELATVTLGTQTDDPLACCLINLWKLDCPQKSGENWAYYTNLQKREQSKSEQLLSSLFNFSVIKLHNYYRVYNQGCSAITFYHYNLLPEKQHGFLPHRLCCTKL